MHRFHVLATATAVALLSTSLLAAPVAADQRGFHLTLPSWDYTSGTCLSFDGDGNCLSASLQTDGVVASTIGGTGTYHGDLLVVFGPGPDCNTVDEQDMFAFATGSLFVASHHEDCRVHGNRIFTDFTVTGGTGAFEGASGGGLEFGNAGSPITYNGRLDR